MIYTDNPVADFARYDAEQSRKLSELPVCCLCGEPIQDEYYYEIGVDILCEKCLNDMHRKYTEDFERIG